MEIFLLGIIVQALFSVTLVTLSAAAVLYALNLAYTQVTGVYYFVDSNIPAAVFLGLHLLVTDPATSPRKSLGKVVFGGLYGAAVFVLYGILTGMGAPGFYDKLLCVPLLNLTVRALDRWAAGFSGRLQIPAWASSWSARQRNFAHMGIWAALFAVMLATGFVGPVHPGRDSEFWHRACQAGKLGACETWAQTLEINCRGTGGDCLTRATEFYRLFNLAEERADKRDPVAAIKLDEALVCYERALEMEPDYIEARADLGIALFRQGRPDEAIVNFEKALAIKPDFAQAHINLGVALIQKGRLDEAIRHFEDALRNDPENGEAQSNLGVALLRTGKLEEAIPHLEKALVATPDSPELHTNLGGALAERGRLDEAIVHFEKAVELAPDSAGLRANLAAGLVQRERWREAVPQFERALELTPDSPSLHTSFGMALLDHGRPDEAIRHFERALALAPDDAQARSHLASALRLQGRAAEALTQWRQVLEEQPDLLMALDEAAWVMATNREASVRNGARAVELAERAVQVSGGHQPRILATLAASYAEAGLFPKAVETAQQALNLAAQQNQQQLAGGLNTMIARYEARTPFRDVR